MADFEEVKANLAAKCVELEQELKGRQCKASYKRVRKLILEITAIGKEYRKLSTAE